MEKGIGLRVAFLCVCVHVRGTKLTHRRQQLKDCFNILRGVVPSLQQKKHSNQAILKGSQKYIQASILCVCVCVCVCGFFFSVCPLILCYETMHIFGMRGLILIWHIYFILWFTGFEMESIQCRLPPVLFTGEGFYVTDSCAFCFVLVFIYLFLSPFSPSSSLFVDPN